MKKSFWLNTIALSVYIFLYAPILVLVAFSFDDSRLAVKWTGFTFKWYESLFTNDSLLSALSNSLFIALISVAIAAVMGTMSAVGLSRLRFAGKGFYQALLLLPIIIPEIAMAVAALSLFIALGLPLSLGTIIVSHIVFCVAYICLVVMGRLEGLDPKLEEAACDLGATPLTAFFKVTLPLLAPGIIAGCLLAFVLSLDDFVITQFTAGAGDTTLPLWIYASVKFGVSPAINALSTVMIVLTVGSSLAAEFLRKKSMS
ncbi:MAG: ABC transporter permease [Candidatus Obscuribacterales bacterium]|nr:ABC transporter permease [Candidatus Obscuribacterales bacterium]